MLWTRGLAWAWRYAGVQEVSIGNGSVAVLATARSGHDLGDIRSGTTSGVRGTCVGMWVQGLGRGWAAVCGAAGLGCSAVVAQHCVGVVELSASGVQWCVQRL